MNRDAMLARLANESFDVLIVGGGASGLGAALDSATRGYRTALIEMADFAAATSSRSTKLVHGGVRYLAQGDLGLVREALHERAILRRNAPHLVHDRTFFAPAYRWYEVPYYWSGLKAYDLLAGRSAFGVSRYHTRASTCARLPWLRERGLRGAIAYHDGQFDDARLAIALAVTAAEHGAALANYARAQRLVLSNGRVTGVHVHDLIDGREFDVNARVVINATGIFVDELRELDDRSARPLLTLSRGTHIVVRGDRLPGTDALLIPRTDDGRVLFVIPWLDHVLIGTTDIPATAPESDPQPTQADLEYLIAHANRYLREGIDHSDVTAAFTGLRPLVDRHASTTAKQSREHLVEISPHGLVSVTGGKWTTYRKMAQDVVDAAAEHASLTPAPCVTANVAIRDDDSHAISALIATQPDLQQPIHPGSRYTCADIVHGIRSEMAQTVDDLLARRTRISFLDETAAREATPTVRALLARERSS